MMVARKSALFALLAIAAPVATSAFDYDIVGGGSIVLTDVSTSISPVSTIFTGEEVAITVDGLEWEANDSNSTGGILTYETFLDGRLVTSGNMSLEGLGRMLPSSIDAGTLTVPSGGRYLIEVMMTVDASEASTSGEYEAYGAGVAILPLIVILVLAVVTNMVELSLYVGIFVGACIVAGDLKGGFKESIENYILNAIADVGHAYVYLFTFFLSGVVAMMEKSGGMIGFTQAISKYAKTSRSGQAAAFFVGLVIFFDDYANTLLAGQTMRPLLDSLMVSRENLAFIVDATAAPIASISPVSSWVGFEVGLIQAEIDRIIELVGTDDISIDTSGFAVFLQSVKYRYYPIFMIILMVVTISLQRSFGPMLIAERKVQVYRRLDGGDGSVSGAAGSMGDHNQPRKDTPLKVWNMLVPIVILIFLIFYCLVQTGDDGSGTQSFMDKIENSDSYAALLWATFGVAVITLIFYNVQITRDGELIIPDFQALKEVFFADATKEDDPEPKARSLMSVKDCVESFLVGMGRVFPASIVLTLAWASGSVMSSVGCDRLFAAWIVGGISPESLPTLSFLISLFMALATGTSWGTMSILFPLLLVPTYQASGGDEIIFYSTVAGILSGSVAGDHMSPISDTTVLSALATECGLMNHVGTQAPYATVVVILSILFGTVPIGFDAWPNIIGILLGVVMIGLFVYFLCVPIVNATGRYDIITTIYFKVSKDPLLEQLQQDTIRAHNGEDLSSLAETKALTKTLGDEKDVILEDDDVKEGEKASSGSEEVEATA